MDNLLLCSVDEFSSMFYNWSINEILEWIDHEPLDPENFESSLGKSTLQALNLGTMFEFDGCNISINSYEWSMVMSAGDIQGNLARAFDVRLKTVRLHVHHEGLYNWWLRRKDLNQDYRSFCIFILHKLRYCLGTESEIDDSIRYGKITRLDLVWDLINCYSAQKWLEFYIGENVKGYQITGFDHQKANVKAIFGTQGQTLYIGSDASEQKLRCYNKFRERGFLANSIIDFVPDSLETYPQVSDLFSQLKDFKLKSWIRFELETRRNKSARFISPSDELPTFIESAESSFYNSFKWIECCQEVDLSKSINQDLFDSVVAPNRRADPYANRQKIIQNEYQVQFKDAEKYQKGLVDQIFYEASYGLEKGTDQYYFVLNNLKQKDSRFYLRLNLRAIEKFHCTLEHLPYFDEVCKKYGLRSESSDISSDQIDSVINSEDLFEQLDILN